MAEKLLVETSCKKWEELMFLVHLIRIENDFSRILFGRKLWWLNFMSRSKPKRNERSEVATKNRQKRHRSNRSNKTPTVVLLWQCFSRGEESS